MPDQNLIINLRLDKTVAERESKEFHAGERQRLAATDKLVKDSARDAIRLEQQKVREAKASTAEIKRAIVDASRDNRAALGSVGQSASNASAAIQRMALGAVGISTLTGAVRSLLSVMERANEQASQQVDKLLRTKDLLREITAITGVREGASDAEVYKLSNIRRVSGLSEQAAINFALEFTGAGEVAKGQNIAATEYERLKPILARFAKGQGGGPEAAGTYGKLGGLLLGVGRYKTAESALATVTQFVDILSAGVGDNPTLVREASEVAGMLLREDDKGLARTPQEVAAMVSLASRSSPGRSGEQIKSITRVMRGFSEKWAPMLGEAGITPEDTVVGSLSKMFTSMEAAEAKGIRPDVFISGGGVDAHGRESLTTLYNYRRMFTKLLGMGAVPMTGMAATARLDEKFRTDIGLKTDIDTAMKETAQLETSMTMQYGKRLEEQAEARLEKRGLGKGSPLASQMDWWIGLETFGGAEFGRKIRLEQEKFALLKEKGIAIPGRPIVAGPMGTGFSFEYMGWLRGGGAEQAYAQAGTTLDLQERMGGRAAVGGGMGDPNTKELVDIEKQKVRLRQTLPPAPIQGRPRVMDR